jgi:hypothetical protein
MQDCLSMEKDKNQMVRTSDINIKNKLDIWMSKNSFMPSLSPLPSLMKKFGDQIKEDKKRNKN